MLSAQGARTVKRLLRGLQLHRYSSKSIVLQVHSSLLHMRGERHDCVLVGGVLNLEVSFRALHNCFLNAANASQEIRGHGPATYKANAAPRLCGSRGEIRQVCEYYYPHGKRLLEN